MSKNIEQQPSNGASSSKFELGPNFDIEWEALDGILFDGSNGVDDVEEDCIRINPISSKFSLSQNAGNSSTSSRAQPQSYASLSSLSTTNISSYLDRNPYPQPPVSSFPSAYPPSTNQDLNEIRYTGSAGSSRKSVEFEEFLKTPAARDLFEGSPMYSFSSIGQISEPSPAVNNTRKTKREEAFGLSGYDDDDADGIKAMRGGSLGRVIASSVAAGTIADKYKNTRLLSGDGSVLDPSILQQAVGNVPVAAHNLMAASGLSKEEERKQLVSQFFQRLNRCDIAGLVKIMRHCDEVCVLSTPDVLEPIVGRSDIMMLISLYIEAYPDGVWTPSAITLVGDTAACNYRFMGTRVFDHPINNLFRQIKTHMSSIMAASSQHQIDFFSNTMDAQRLVNEIAESAVPNDIHHVYKDKDVASTMTWQEQQQQIYQYYHSHSSSANNSGPSSEKMVVDASDDLESNRPIMIRRQSRSLREVKAIETAVLQEGPTTYRRKLEFIFNEYNEIIQILFTNVL